MSFRIIASTLLAPEVRRVRIEAPLVARHHRAGQFVIVRVEPGGERIPLTVARADAAAGWIDLIVQAVGHTTGVLVRLEAGEVIPDVVGPLGCPTEIDLYGTVVVVGGGVGTAVTYPAARALREAGNRVIAIVGAKSAAAILLEDELRAAGCEVIVTTEDGTAGRAGLVTDALRAVMRDRGLDRVLAAGPIPMMRAVAEVTRPDAIPTIVSLNPIMVDGTGMCGGCRVRIGGEIRFACVDGPEFDGHAVDYGTLARRNRAYVEFERRRDEVADAHA